MAAGGVADLGDATGLTSAFSQLSPGCGSARVGTTRAGSPWGMAMMLADGGQAIADLAVLRDPSALVAPGCLGCGRVAAARPA